MAVLHYFVALKGTTFKTDYFLLYFLYKNDWRISVASAETKEEMINFKTVKKKNIFKIKF